MSFDVETAYTDLRARLGERVRRAEPLARHCTFGVGGPADIWVSLERREDLLDLVTRCAEQRWPLLITGNGTNVLYADAGVRGIVARIAMSSYILEDRGDGTALLTAGAGVSWPRLLNELVPLGWGGLEFGPGIPGTLGGGVISNAGAHQGDLGRVLQWVEVVDARRCETQPLPPWWCTISMLIWIFVIVTAASALSALCSSTIMAIHWPHLANLLSLAKLLHNWASFCIAAIHCVCVN